MRNALAKVTKQHVKMVAATMRTFFTHCRTRARSTRVIGETVRRRATDLRYERDLPGALLHVDVKKLGRVPNGGGWRVHGRSVLDGRRGPGRGLRTRRRRGPHQHRLRRSPQRGKGPDLRGVRAPPPRRPAARFWHAHGVTSERVLTDNARSYRRSHDRAAVCAALQI